MADQRDSDSGSDSDFFIATGEPITASSPEKSAKESANRCTTKKNIGTKRKNIEEETTEPTPERLWIDTTRPPIAFRARCKWAVAVFSNFFGNAEYWYMIDKFDCPKNKPIIDLLRCWMDGRYVDHTGNDRTFDGIRFALAKCVVTGGQLVPKGGKAGAPFTAMQLGSYKRLDAHGHEHYASGILMKLLAAVWKNKARRRVLEHLAGMRLDTMDLPLNLYHWDPTRQVDDHPLEAARRALLDRWGVPVPADISPAKLVALVRETSMRRALRQKYAKGTIYYDLLLATGDRPLQEVGNDKVFGSGPGCANLLGRLLMELRATLTEGGTDKQ